MKHANISVTLLAILLSYTLSVTFAFQYFFTTERQQIHSGLIIASRTITVPDDYPTIQEAINNANEGDTILVRNGTYSGSIIVNKTLTLEGENRISAIIDGGRILVIANNVRISKFTIQHAESIYIDGYVRITISDNIMMDNFQGIRLVHTSDNIIIGNVIDGNSAGDIGFDWANNNIVFNNTLSKSGGLAAIHGGYPSYNNSFIENKIIGNNLAVEMNNVFNDNEFYHNNFINNTIQVSFIGTQKVNVWDNGYPSGGNYWSDYSGIDVGNDGIGDSPYVIDANNTDNYPLMNPWTPPNIAVMSVTPSKTIIGQGFSLNINVTVANLGNKIENFNISVLANETSIGLETVMLADGSSLTITIEWNIAGFVYGNYAISAYLEPILGEINITDNGKIDGYVIITAPGDINGDSTVNFLDAIVLGVVFNSKLGDPNWNHSADINNDGYVNFLDAIVLGANFGQS